MGGAISRPLFLPFCISSSLAYRSPADRPPSGANWIHEIKHDGYRLMAQRDSVALLITRRAAMTGRTASRSWSRQ